MNIIDYRFKKNQLLNYLMLTNTNEYLLSQLRSRFNS